MSSRHRSQAIGAEARAVDDIDVVAPGFTLAFLRACPDAVAILNVEGRVGFLNQAGHRTMEIDATESVSGRAWWDLWPDADRSALETGFRRAVSGELVRLKAGRAARMWDITLSPIINLAGETESVLMVSRVAP
ncbi:PAS domain-containing protein [Aestuariibius sp. 2305UL40-4]|uniref:PAS domain-containing protein n=1 Tax=Aestuariibius violaceus TaxID=3234132 RepID=UPI00345E08C0